MLATSLNESEVAILDLDALQAALADLRLPECAGARLIPLQVKGLAHDHVAVGDLPLLLRVPKQSQFAFAAADNLAYQAACFQRVSASGHGPRLHGMIAPQPEIPMGALLVERIAGRPPRLPEDLPSLAEAMARVHSLPLPDAAARSPLQDHKDPLAGIRAEIERQAAFLDEAGIEPEARAEIEAELDWLRSFADKADLPEQPRCLVLTDTHPGNFLIDANGKAVIVDLEKALYGSPGIDLAHATIYSSTTWDLDSQAELTVSEVADFYRHYLAVIERECGKDFAEALRPWLLPMRRALFLRAVTWCAKWQVLHSRSRQTDKQTANSTEDWSAENSDPALIAHVAGRVALYLSPPAIARMRGDWTETDASQQSLCALL